MSDETPASAARPRRAWRILRGIARLLALLLLTVVLVGGLWLRSRLRASLPVLAGTRPVAGLGARVVIERDALGVPVLRGSSRRDLAFATGFVHAQDRFFQMDLMRRRPAGELSEVVGGAAVDRDREIRVHRLRVLARHVLERSSPEIRGLLEAYSAGVNAGLASLAGRPFEYLVLRAEPRPWRPEDCVLVLLGMFVQLEGGADGGPEREVARMHDLFPEPVFRFLVPEGTDWDAPLAGAAFPPSPIPGPDVLDLRRRPQAATPAALRHDPDLPAPPLAASTAMALSGARSAAGEALLADELHLDISVPNLWYRLSLVWPLAMHEQRVTGVTLPGTPAIVVGSNGRVAWGFSNSLADTSDVVVLDPEPKDPDSYRTPAGPRRLERVRETIQIKGEAARPVDVEQTVWGPVVGRDDHGRRLALRWVAQEEGAVDFEAIHLETVRSVAEALDIAHRSGFPALNMVAADAGGHVGWTTLGRLPRRIGFDGELPGSWADGRRRWDGLLPPGQVPQIIDPPSGQVWSANQRMIDGPGLDLLGHGGYLFAARAHQIRDDLSTLPTRAGEGDLLRIQLDDRAVLLSRWQRLLLQSLTPAAMAADPRRAELRKIVERWGARAAVDSAGYRLVRTFRVLLARRAFEPIVAPARRLDPEFDYVREFDQFEGPLWELVTTRPAHLLDPRYRSWDELFLAAADEVIQTLTEGGRTLDSRTWGERNTTAIRHPLSRALPGSSRWLDMPALQLPGDQDMPRVQHPAHGATLRMIVAPGHEERGIFEMPCGQSGHPLSPHYRDGHAAWAQGAPTSFLPGPPIHTLVLTPAGKS
jgi:penicillin amidase